MKKQSFAAGAAILMISNAVSKILGAGFKIPLTYILREEGMAVYNTAFTVYVMFLSFIISGIPTAVSKTVAQSDERGAFMITDISEKVLSVLGIAASAALYFGAEFFALAMKEPGAINAIRIIAPSVFLVALGTGCKSFFHGASSMTVPAVSQVAESVIKLAVGYVLAVMLVKLGKEAGAAGAVAGVTVGEFIATAILLGAYLFMRLKVRVKSTKEEKRNVLKELVSIAFPLLIAEVVLNAVSVTDTSVLRTRMLSAGLSEEEARFLYGSFTGYAMTVFNLPVGILATIGVSLLPAVASAVADKNMLRAKKALNSGVELTLFISVPSAVMLWLIPGELLEMLFHNSSSALLLKFMAPCVVTVSLVQLLSAVIQACGNVVLPSVFITCGLILKIGIMWVLCAMPKYNIYGTVIASNAAYLFVLIIEIIAVKKTAKTMPQIAAALIIPCMAAAVMAIAVNKAMEYCKGSIMQVIAVCAAGGSIYIIVSAIMYMVMGRFKGTKTQKGVV